MATLYWFKSGANASWNTLTGNWWTDSGHTAQAGALPTDGDSLYFDGSTAPTVGPLTSMSFALIDTSNLAVAWTMGLNIRLAAGATMVLGNAGGQHVFGGSCAGTITLATFNNDSLNGGTIVGPCVFNDTSINNNTVTGDATFNGSSYNSGTVTGNATFNGSSYNSSTVTGDATFNGSSYNNGTVGSNATFNSSANNRGTVTGNATFNGSSYLYSGTVTGNATFNDSSFNLGTVTGVATFNDTAYNYTANISAATLVVFGATNTATHTGTFPSTMHAYGQPTVNGTFQSPTTVHLKSSAATFKTTTLTAGSLLIQYDGPDGPPAGTGANYTLSLGL